jgi:hypothetical protein
MIAAIAAPAQGAHPAYLHALADLRAARWLIDHRPGDWKQTADEMAAVRSIDAAINDIKQAAIDDHKNVNDHMGVQEIPDRGGRLAKAAEILRRTRGDLNREEDNGFAKGLKARALHDVDEAIRFTQKAMHP